MSDKNNNGPESDPSILREEKSLSQQFLEMPYSHDKVGQSFVMFCGQCRIVSGDMAQGEDPAERRKGTSPGEKNADCPGRAGL